MSISSVVRKARGTGSRLVALGLLGLLLGTSLLTVGCAGKNPHPTGSFARAAHYADKGKDIAAVAAFESFLRHNPTDSLAAEAQFLKSKTYMNMKEYPLAAVEFQILRKDYPTSRFVEDALFEEGKAYLLQVGRVERDLTGAFEARLHFLKFSQEYPMSSYMPEVVGYMQEISDLMVRKRLEQVKVYWQLKRYKAIAIVLDGVMVDEAASTLIPEVMWERARIAARLDDPDAEAEMYRKLISQYPDGPYYKRAVRSLQKLDQQQMDDEQIDDQQDEVDPAGKQ